ncbi:MAG: class I SAM-dependent rRNA methyltransferase [Bacteroidales bacterium]|nr:class I SAM-dependent rRNA methyltransferase [Bacteroidales bacterium]MBN2818738.1 class I SAM-dependent rRNA methyltransferase [Bacteroidales bacterium]
MSEKYVKVVLKSGKDQSLRRFHPWVFSGAIKKMYGEPSEGDIVAVFDNKDEFLGLGHYQIGSITIRVFSFNEVEPDYEFWKSKIFKAYEVRQNFGLTDAEHTNVYRLFFGEGDGIPGLIIDYYNGNVVMQIHSIGAYKLREILVEILKELYGENLQSVFDKSESTLPKKGPVDAKNEFLLGDSQTEVVKENGLNFRVNWIDGQKTGFFIDQRDNRKLLQKYSLGRKVLNMFCYTGGFSVYSIRGGAELVHSVDSSARAIDLVKENVGLNFSNAPHEAFAVDAFKYLDDIKDKYDLIILDPPAFAKHLNVLSNALQGYKRLNQVAFEQIKPGGILFTFSCSQVVSKENFRKSVFAAAANAKRNVRILHQLSQPVDHPISIFHPEGEYLKGLVLYVE